MRLRPETKTNNVRMRKTGVSYPSVPGSGTALLIQLCHRRFNRGTSSRWRTWLVVFTTLCFLWVPGCDAGREKTCWSLTAPKSRSPGFPRRETGPLNTGWRAQSQTAPGNNRPDVDVALHRVTNWYSMVVIMQPSAGAFCEFNKWISGVLQIDSGCIIATWGQYSIQMLLLTYYIYIYFKYLRVYMCVKMIQIRGMAFERYSWNIDTGGNLNLYFVINKRIHTAQKRIPCIPLHLEPAGRTRSRNI